MNILTFLLKAIATNDVESLKTIIPNHDIKKKKTVLILIGTLRLLLKSNKSLMKFILKGLISRDDQSSGKGVQTQILKKQFKALSLKSSVSEQQLEVADSTVSIDTTTQQPKKQVATPSSLAEIFSLIKTEYFKGDKMLLRNLSLLIQ